LSAPGWSAANTIAVVAVVVAGVLGPYVSYRIQRAHWRRDRRSDAYVAAISLHHEQRNWRDALDREPLEMPRVGGTYAVLKLVGTSRATAAGEACAKTHEAVAGAYLANRADVRAGQHELSVGIDEMRALREAADAAGEQFLLDVRTELGF
jgi:hypothetical protein